MVEGVVSCTVFLSLYLFLFLSLSIEEDVVGIHCSLLSTAKGGNFFPFEYFKGIASHIERPHHLEEEEVTVS